MKQRPRTSEPDPDDGIEEISLQDATTGMAGEWWDRLLVGIAVIAVGGGLVLAGANALGLTGPSSTTAKQSADAAAASANASASAESFASLIPAQPTAAELWALTAANHLTDIGGVFRYECPPRGTAFLGDVFGLGYYALDSSVCTAAVHWGLISANDGGSVSIQIQPGVARFAGERSNGVDSHESGPADASFTFVAQDSPSGVWSATAAVHRRNLDERFDYACPSGGTASPIWGTRIYTDDSSVCTAAVHAGLITFQRGGSVTIEMRPGRQSYRASVANHVVSGTWGSWDASFVFVKPSQ